MGDYADDFNDAGIGDWHGGGRAQYWGASRDLPPQYCHARKRCNRCGSAPLYWEQHEGEWRLHAYANGAYILHSCASADTHPKDGDSTEIEAPLVSGAVGAAETPKAQRHD